MTDAPAVPRWSEYRALNDLPSADRNAKDHDQEALARSVTEFGFVEPVVLDERTGKLLAGHGRKEYLAVLEANGGDPPDGVMVGQDGRWEVQVVRGVTSRDDQHADALGVALNRVGERGGWHTDILAIMFDEIIGTPLAEAAGWTADELDDLIASTSGGLELADQGTEADYAKLTNRGEPGVPREVQGIHEVGLMFQADQHREYQALLAQLKARYAIDAAPLVVLRAMQDAAASEE